MNDLAVRWLVGLVLLLAVAASGYWKGDQNRNNAWLAKQAKVEREAHAKYEAEVKRGVEAAGSYLEDKRDQENSYAELEERFKALRQRVPLLVPSPAAPAVQAAGAGPESNQPAGPGINVFVQPELSLGAVWMWNSALAGADVPTNTCGTDAATAQACAAGSGLTIGDAWDNQKINAKSCAEDRLRHQRLIDFLKGRDEHRAPIQKP